MIAYCQVGRSYSGGCRMMRRGSRWKNWGRIDSLDPEQDYSRICELFFKDFAMGLAWSALEGYGVTYSIPSMSRILIRGQLYSDIDKRATDSSILTGTMYAKGFGPGDGREALKRMNQMHRMYPIQSQDFVFVSTL